MNIVARSEQMHASGGRIEGGSLLTGHLGLASLLVREAVQNSWDARDEARTGPVNFSVEGWDLDTDELDHLRGLLPVEHLQGFGRLSDADDDVRGILHPSVPLSRPSAEVLVISDRRTVGLCGPTLSGREWEPVRHGLPLDRGQKRFANFIRNQGRATADTGHGDGGAYGIGKNALWMASTCGTILVHTRTSDENGEPVERFIGAIHGEYFSADGYEYTGRHFVGREADQGIIEPLTGADAANARRGLPLPSYEVDGQPTDGTSIVIVAPRFQLGWEVEMMRLRDAVRWHVWPKRVPGVRSPDAEPDMHVELKWNNNTVDLPPPLEDPEVRPYARALLDCARDRISSEPSRDHPVRCGRPSKLLGAVKFRDAGSHDDNVFHLTLTEGEIEDAARQQCKPVEGIDPEPAISLTRPWGQIALVRREPLLLVRYEPIGGPDAAATEIGVFLSADDPEVEDALTKAEPPAHDDWIHQIVPKDHPRDHRRTFAKRTVEDIKAARKRFIGTFRSSDPGALGGGEQAVSRRISEGIFGGFGGGPRPRNPKNGGGGGRSGPRATLALVRSDQDEHQTVHELDVTLTDMPTGSGAILTASGSGYDNVGAMAVDGQVSFQWMGESGLLATGSSITLQDLDLTRLALVVTVAGDLRFRPKVSVEVNRGA